jgi:hypothetical protein
MLRDLAQQNPENGGYLENHHQGLLHKGLLLLLHQLVLHFTAVLVKACSARQWR